MAIRIPRLCAITDRSLAGGLSHEEIARALVGGGASWIQVREKSLAPREYLEQSRRVVAAVKSSSEERSRGGRVTRARVLVMINDRVDIAMASGADGVHVGRDDLPPDEARALMGPGAIIGVSTHSLEEGTRAADLPVDYVAIGPVFSTTTKADSEPVVGVETVRRLSAAVRLPVVGIGGIGPENAKQVMEAGAAAVAVISALYRPERSIEENVAILLRSLG